MLREIAGLTARRVAGRLSPESRRRVREILAPVSFRRNMRGVVPNREMVAWARTNARPVSIVIPSYNDLPLLTACLRSIRTTCAGIDYEVIVVDDYIESDNAAQLQKLADDRVTVVLKDERLGFAGTVNVGMALARHDIVLLNSDTVATEGWLEALQYAAYARDPKVGLVSPKLVYPDGRIQYGGTYYAGRIAPQWFGHLYVGRAASDPVANVPGYNGSISGACVYIRRDAYDRLGPLDERFWLGFEDVDYGLAAWAAGVRCYYEPAATLVHHESASRGYSQGPRELRSMRYFWERWETYFLARELPQGAPVDYVLSPLATPFWAAYVAGQAEALRDRGRDVTVHRTALAGEVDEAVVERLTGRASLKIAADPGAAVTVWLSSVDSGKAVMLYPGGAEPIDRRTSAHRLADLRPEFAYVVTDRWNAEQVEAATSWAATAHVPPAAPPPVVAPQRSDLVVAFDVDPRHRPALDEVAGRHGARIDYVEYPAGPDQLRELVTAGPRAIICLAEFSSSLEPLLLMACGAALIARAQPQTHHEVLDGYNALLVEDGSMSGALDSVLSDDDGVRAQLAANGRATCERLARQNGIVMHLLLDEISTVSS